MTRLERVLELLEDYDDLASWYCEGREDTMGHGRLLQLRKKKEKLTEELIEHGCRRRD